VLMSKDLEEAKKRMIDDGYTCVVMKDEQMYTSTERGVKPLLAWLDGGIDLRGFAAADKVIGNGAAMLYVLLGVTKVYTPVISEAARKTLEQHGIKVQYEQCVSEIRNRTDTGTCPMEEAVSGINNPEDALLAIRRRLQSMQMNRNN